MAVLYHDFMHKCIDRKDFQLIWKKQIALFGKFIRVFVKEKIKKGNREGRKEYLASTKCNEKFQSYKN